MAEDKELDAVRRHVTVRTGRSPDAFTSADLAHVGRHLGEASRSRRRDVHLPNETGVRDPRLPIAKKAIAPARSLKGSR